MRCELRMKERKNEEKKQTHKHPPGILPYLIVVAIQ